MLPARLHHPRLMSSQLLLSIPYYKSFTSSLKKSLALARYNIFTTFGRGITLKSISFTH